MSNTLLIATHNPHKAEEIRQKLNDSAIRVVTLTDLGDHNELTEDGDTFEANATAKAWEAYARHHLPTIADDSGLCVDTLHGAPGVRSKRFSPEATDEANNRLLLRLMDGIADRTARFVCVIVYIDPTGHASTYRGELEGKIAMTPAGAQGFGYDPLFVPKGFKRHLAQLSLTEKNRLSHRAKALQMWLDDGRKS